MYWCWFDLLNLEAKTGTIQTVVFTESHCLLHFSSLFQATRCHHANKVSVVKYRLFSQLFFNVHMNLVNLVVRLEVVPIQSVFPLKENAMLSFAMRMLVKTASLKNVFEFVCLSVCRSVFVRVASITAVLSVPLSVNI